MKIPVPLFAVLLVAGCAEKNAPEPQENTTAAPDLEAGATVEPVLFVADGLNADGSLGERNDAYPVSVEHKLGIHGSPTCVMAYGDNGGAIGYLVGEENQGLACMLP